MRYPILMFLLVSFCISCSKDPKIGTEQSETFMKFFGTTGIDSSAQLLVVDGGYLMLANETSGLEHRGCLYKTNVNGNQLWQSYISDSLNSTAKSIINAQGGGFYVCGDVKDSAKYSHIFVANVDDSGVINWLRIYKDTVDQKANSIVQDANSNLIIAGTTFTDKTHNESRQDVLLLKLSVDGDRLWSKNYGGALSDMASGVAMGTDGLIYIIGSTLSYKEAQQDKSNILLLVTKPDGYLLHRITYGGMGNDYGYGIAVSESGAVFISGAVENANNETDGWLACISGNVYAPAWTATVGRRRNDALLSIVNSGTELFAAGYSRSEETGNKDLFIVKYSTDGVSLGEYISGGEGDETATSVSFASDGQPVATGTSEFESNAVIFMLKTKL